MCPREAACVPRWDYWGKPVPFFGDPEARMLILGPHPLLMEANRTGRMFTGDRSGDYLFRALPPLDLRTAYERFARRWACIKGRV